ncbi:type II toxin-antitoxin system Phd/YefM family antitoxin [Ochrobactrum teleogrylli]|uniref:Antitoxin n=1 Tax=Ochrobactrum teleogrylli TaxID=2479765 RepID=A0ABY2Y0M2_9HYPH|nr:type II toxin-antitoxin system Phd/YefM family antitoxin [[Ochrobactrum] teleogrylli]TNV09308.1 type II toxin-antitoxin system Phd/YefM family antitoxin [[Ochrobactrum] teleogrylli]
MKSFSFSEMNRASGDILDAALAEPVALTKRGKEKLIIVSTEVWDKVISQAKTKAYTLENAPQNTFDQLMGGLEENVRNSPK